MNPQNPLPEQVQPTNNQNNGGLPPDNIVPSSGTVNPELLHTPAVAPMPQSTPTPPTFINPSQPPQPSGVDLMAGAKPPRRWAKLALIPAALLSLSVVAAGAWFVFLKADDPETLFRKSLETALSTKNLQIDTKQSYSDTSLTSVIKMDVANVKEPKISAVIKDKYDGGESTSQVYSTPKNLFFNSTDSSGSPLLGLEAVDGKWVQITQDSESSDGYGSESLASAGYSSWTFFGYLIHGNFSSKQKKEFTNFLIENDVYKYDVTKVKSVDSDGSKQLVYKVDVDEAELREFNKMVAKSIGIKESLAENNLALLSGDLNIKFYIDSKKNRIVKLELDESGITSEVKLSGFNQTALPAEPKAEITYEEYLNLLDQYDEGSGGVSGSTDDIERKTDINALHGQVEAYYAQNGAYPALTEINNPSWRAENMKGLDAAALQDPSGTTQKLAPTASKTQYGYGAFQEDGVSVCSTDEFDCAIYTLTAILKDGGTYTKASLN